MASSYFARSRHIGLLVARSPTAVDSAVGETGVRETIVGLERLGLRPRLYTLDAAAPDVRAPHGIGASGAGLMRIAGRVALHAYRLAIAPLRYLAALGSAMVRHRAGLAEFALAVRLASTLRRDRIVHLHACDPASASLAETVARLTGLRFSMSIASVTLDEADQRSVKRCLIAAQFSLMPTDTALHAAKAIAPRAAVHRAYPGVDYRHYCPKLRSRLASVPLLLAVGEPRAHWDLAPLVDACRMLALSGLALRCEVVGAARDLPRMQAHIDGCGLSDRVRLVGPLSASRLMERYSRAAIFVQVPNVAAQASLAGIPTGLLEAMAMGLPVIATRTPATEECVTHASSGWLVRSGDAAQLFEAIQRLLVQPRLGESLGKQARETVVERFDSDVNLHTLQRLLEAASKRVAVASNHSLVGGPTAQAAHSTAFRFATAPHRRGLHELHHA